jgi:hypothetical protein
MPPQDPRMLRRKREPLWGCTWPHAARVELARPLDGVAVPDPRRLGAGPQLEALPAVAAYAVAMMDPLAVDVVPVVPSSQLLLASPASLRHDPQVADFACFGLSQTLQSWWLRSATRRGNLTMATWTPTLTACWPRGNNGSSRSLQTSLRRSTCLGRSPSVSVLARELRWRSIASLRFRPRSSYLPCWRTYGGRGTAWPTESTACASCAESRYLKNVSRFSRGQFAVSSTVESPTTNGDPRLESRAARWSLFP